MRRVLRDGGVANDLAEVRGDVTVDLVAVVELVPGQ